MSSYYLLIHPFISLFRGKVSHNHGWALTYCVTKHDLEHLVLLSPPTEEYRMYHHTWSAWCWISNPELPECKANHLLTDIHSQLHHGFLNAKHLTQYLRCETLMDFLSPAKWRDSSPIPTENGLYSFLWWTLSLLFISPCFHIALSLFHTFFFFYRFNYIYTFNTFFEENNLSVSFSDIPSHFFFFQK